MNYSSGITSDDEDMENQMVGNGASEARTNESELSETLLDVANRMALAGEDTPMQEEATHEHKKQKQDHTGLPNPQKDKEALETLHRIAGSKWVTVNGALFTYRSGLWTQDENAFLELLMQHETELGEYGRKLARMSNVQKLAKTKNIVDETWTQQLDHLRAGLVPFADGIYDVVTSKLRAFHPDDMITKKFDFNAPSAILDDDTSFEVAKVRSIIEDVLPEEKLRNEVMVRLAESFFSPINTHKYFMQLYGEGNNGKTTLFRILQTAFPGWVKMPSVEHLVIKSKQRDPNAPQPWLIDVMGARILAFEEPGEGCPFDGALLKQLRGNGMVTGRALFKGNVSYIPQFTVCIASNGLIDIKPMDQAVLNSLHSFELPSHFCEGNAPPGAKYPKQKIPNLEGLFKERKYKLALFAVLREYYSIYRCKGLPALESEFSRPVAELYRAEHRGALDLLEHCFIEDKSSLRVPEKILLQKLIQEGCEESQQKMKLVMQKHYGGHAFIKRYQHRHVFMWDGLTVDRESTGFDPGEQFA